MNYFELFGLPVAPSVDRSVIARKYFELQKKFHPDFHSLSDEFEKEEVIQKSAAINKAFKIFQDPDQTLHYFLETTGVIEPGEKYDLPATFLSEMMEINEAIDDNEMEAKKLIEGLEHQLWDEIKFIVLNYHMGTTDGEDLLKLKSYYYKKKYLQRILDRLSE